VQPFRVGLVGLALVTAACGGSASAPRKPAASSNISPRVAPEPVLQPAIRVRTGDSPTDIAVGRGKVWVADVEVVQIDPELGKAVGSTGYVGALLVAVTEDSLWYTSVDGDFAERIDLSANTGKEIAVGTTPTAVAVGEGAAWVANSGDGTVSRIDLDTNQVVATISVGTEAVDVEVGEGLVWVTAPSSGAVARVDPRTNKLAGPPIAVGTGAWRVAIGEGAVWVTERDGGSVADRPRDSEGDPRDGSAMPPCGSPSRKGTCGRWTGRMAPCIGSIPPPIRQRRRSASKGNPSTWLPTTAPCGSSGCPGTSGGTTFEGGALSAQPKRPGLVT
jgi:YVTN family beta-propeller protein